MIARRWSHPRYCARAVGFVALAFVAAAIGWLLFVPPPVPGFETVRAQWQPSEAWLLDRHGAVVHQRRVDARGRRLAWVPLAAISPALRDAVIAGEDRRFFAHRGVDYRALAGATWTQVRGGRARGASTLTMQLAALVEPALRPVETRRTLAQKLCQLRWARGVETRWSKAQILEAYLNLATFRGELQGIGAASKVLFGKSADGLDRRDARLLAALLPAPNGTPTSVVARACRRARLAPDEPECRAIAARAELALQAPVASPVRKASARELAPQLAARLLTQPGIEVRTTLDARIQRAARDALREQIEGLATRNVRDGAALVVDNASGAVLAYVGSGGASSRAREVDGVRARRQAGSTLKPFLYAHALERRYLTAASVLADTPVNLETTSGLYIPQNYDRDFRGPVSVRSALAGSLNVPAVRALVLVGVEAFRDRLYAAGYRGITESGEFYGYALALGSAEVSLWEQVSAFRMLARGGIWGPLHVQPDEPAAAAGREARVLEPGAAFVVADILADRGARAATFGLNSTLDTRYWSAVKTGTSKDMRDNWCIGFSARYTVGVWVGNFEGDAMHGVSGVDGAAPVWLELMNVLHADAPPPAPHPPRQLVRTAIRFVPAIEPPRAEWFLAGTEAATIELLAPTATAARIAAPANGAVLALDPDIPRANQHVVFDARGERRDVTFVLNGARLGPARRPYYWQPAPGSYTLTLADARGAPLDTVRFMVRDTRR